MLPSGDYVASHDFFGPGTTNSQTAVIAANKFRSVRAVLCQDEIAAEISRRHCDRNVLCLSFDLTAQEMIRHVVETWLAASFEGGRHARRLDKIIRLEDDNMK